VSRSTLRPAIVLLAAVAAGACGGARPAPVEAAPPVPPAQQQSEASSPETLDGLAGDLESAEQKLNLTLGSLATRASGAPADEAKKAEESSAAAEPAAGAVPKAATKPEPPARPSPTADAGDSSVPLDCTTACKALASMRRSAERICDLAGAAHERCTWANARVELAARRVADAGCSCAKD